MDVKQLGMIGVGNMGGMMSLLFADYGIHVHSYDPSQRSVKALQSHAAEAGLSDSITIHKGYQSICAALPSPRVFVFSIPHGKTGDDTIDGLLPYLQKGDVLMDASNEKWTRTERRQARLEPLGIHFIGMGVSGGYQSARHGPSISPGGTPEALDLVLPFLKKVAAKDKKGRPCTARLGPGGCGHYVKMVHNGIEHGMMTALCEAWGIMVHGLGMEFPEIAAVLDGWNASGPLRDNFLVSIGAVICRTKDAEGNFVISNVRDKVVQDVDDSEGTGTWTVEEGARLHVPIPTIAASHCFRVASADAAMRRLISSAFDGGVRPRRIEGADREQVLRELHAATYASFLVSFVQGMFLLSKADKEQGWGLDFGDVLQLWRGGCIIESDFIVDMIEEAYRTDRHSSTDSLLSHRRIGEELEKAYPMLKKTVVRAVEADLNVPAISASLEYYKYSGSTDLPTSFQEAELDFFGAHMYDLKTAEPGKPVMGTQHTEWRPAKGIFND